MRCRTNGSCPFAPKITPVIFNENETSSACSFIEEFVLVSECRGRVSFHKLSLAAFVWHFRAWKGSSFSTLVQGTQFAKRTHPAIFPHTRRQVPSSSLLPYVADVCQKWGVRFCCLASVVRTCQMFDFLTRTGSRESRVG